MFGPIGRWNVFKPLCVPMSIVRVSGWHAAISDPLSVGGWRMTDVAGGGWRGWR